MIRAVVDTSVLVSAFIGHPDAAPSQVVIARRDRGFVLIVSPCLLDELSEVLARPKFTTWAADGRGEAYAASFAASAEAHDDPPVSLRHTGSRGRLPRRSCPSGPRRHDRVGRSRSPRGGPDRCRGGYAGAVRCALGTGCPRLNPGRSDATPPTRAPSSSLTPAEHARAEGLPPTRAACARFMRAANSSPRRSTCLMGK